MPELTVAAGLARGLIDLAISKGASEAELAARSGIDPAALADQDTRIPFAKYVVLMRVGQELTNDPALALHYGETNDMSKISIVGLIANASATTMEAFAQLNRYGRLVVEFDGGPERFKLVGKNGGTWLVDTRGHPNEFPELTESTFARMICGPRTFGVAQLAKCVHVTHSAPAHRAEYDRVFGAPTVFNSDWNAIELDPRWITHKVSDGSRYVFGILSDRAELLLKELENSKSVRGKVESLLMPVLHTGNASMDAVAAKMALSRQTLARRLKGEGTTFEKLLDALRHRMAVHYLDGKKVSVNETAYLVGFSERAAFARAFKRWTGKSPGQYRGS